VAVGGAVTVLELRVLDLDHGTHLLVALTLVIGLALLLGPGPAATGFAAGGALAAGASVFAIRGVLGMPEAFLQLATYVLGGAVVIILVSAAVRARRGQPSQRPAAQPAMAPGGDLVEPLTAREFEVLRLAASGIPVEEIARRLFVSPNTAKTHLSHIYAKLGVHGRSDAIRAALHCGCLTPNDICPHLLADRPGENHPNG
jgi:DNA-binding CsgD family transcriptional regulator